MTFEFDDQPSVNLFKDDLVQTPNDLFRGGSDRYDDRWDNESDEYPFDPVDENFAETQTTNLVAVDDFFSFIAGNRVVWGLMIAATVVVIWLVLWSFRSSKAATADAVYLSGKSVAQLRQGADVVWGELTIGRVTEVNSEGINPTAELDISQEYRARLPHSARLEVGSLNPLLPGNVGVIVTASENPSEPRLGSHVKAATRLLPAQTPIGFWLVVAITLLALFVGIAVRLQAITVRLFWKAMAAFLLTLAIHLCCRTIASIDTVKEWSNEAQEMFQENF